MFHSWARLQIAQDVCRLEKGTFMKSALIAAFAFAGVFAFTGCGQGSSDGTDITSKSSSSAVGAAYVTEMTRIADALDTVKDEASARRAATEIRKAADGLENMQEQLGDISGMRAMQIFGSNYQELMTAQTRMMASMVRIQMENPELMEFVSDEMDRLND